VLGVHIQFFEMDGVRLDHLNVSEPNRRVAQESDPEMPLTLSLGMRLTARRFGENRLGRVTGKKLRRGELDRRQ
jgi:hypothetical protein